MNKEQIKDKIKEFITYAREEGVTDDDIYMFMDDVFPQGEEGLAENKYRAFINSVWGSKPSTFDKLTPKQQICMMGKADGFDDGVKAQHSLDQQHEANALKEQRERIQDKIDKSYLYLKSLCLAAEDDGEFARGYDLAMNEALSQLVNLKSQLESE